MLVQPEKGHAVSRRRMAKSSTKRSRSKGNSLPPTKRFDFTTVGDDFEESQHGFAPKDTNADAKKCMKLGAFGQLTAMQYSGIYCISGAFDV